ncbi:MAG: response regulator [Desulfobulbales bacterium]|nr:response regulator [Desulfobulbales bacterium]
MNNAPRRILIVDDDEMLCLLLARWLSKENYDCTTVYSGEAALTALAQSPFELLITDLNMPGISGIELLGRIRGKHPDMISIVVSAVDDRSIAINALELDAFAYMIKPIDKSETIINVANAMRHRRLELENRQYTEEMNQLVIERTRKLQETEEEVRLSRDETICCLARAAEFRDNETAQHTIRMGSYCQLLAEKAKLDPETCKRIGDASPLHDVGKIGIPDQILLKPGRVTPEEFEIIKTHCDIGYRILGDSSSELLKMAATIALSHHEKVDGSGYPRGLAGDAIPIAGRIAAVCDVFDALTFDRIYKKAFSIEKSIEILKEGRGSHFDAKLLDLFLASLDEILLIKTHYAE